MRAIKELEIFEVSFVMYPANPHCVVIGVSMRLTDD